MIGVGPLRAVLRVFARDAREVTDQPIAVGSGFAGILVVALVIAGVDVLETSFLLLVVNIRSRD